MPSGDHVTKFVVNERYGAKYYGYKLSGSKITSVMVAVSFTMYVYTGLLPVFEYSTAKW